MRGNDANQGAGAEYIGQRKLSDEEPDAKIHFGLLDSRLKLLRNLRSSILDTVRGRGLMYLKVYGAGDSGPLAMSYRDQRYYLGVDDCADVRVSPGPADTWNFIFTLDVQGVGQTLLVTDDCEMMSCFVCGYVSARIKDDSYFTTER